MVGGMNRVGRCGVKRGWSADMYVVFLSDPRGNDCDRWPYEYYRMASESMADVLLGGVGNNINGFCGVGKL